MFNVLKFKKAVKSLGRKASNIDEFCDELGLYLEAKEVELYMVAEKKSRKRRAEQDMYIPKEIKERLEYLRGEIEAEQISMDEIHELQSLSNYIDPSDGVLREWAGLPENTEASKKKADYQGYKNYETWNVDLWLDNNQFQAPEEITDLHELADYIKEMVEEGNPLADAESSMYQDLLNGALSEVDYRQIAQFRLGVEE